MGARTPQRRCAGCGRITAKGELLRLALSGRQGDSGRTLMLDRDARMPGRGAYLCRAAVGGTVPSPDCLALAMRRGGIARTLRCSAQLDLQDFVESVSQ